MIDAGLVDEDLRGELLDGRISPLPAKSTHHRESVARAYSTLHDQLPRDLWRVLQEQPVALSEISEPEPDIVVVPAGRYLDDHPAAGQALLVIECAWTTLEADRRKAQLYRRAGAAHAWVVDIRNRVVEVYGPDGLEQHLGEGATLAFGEFTIAAANLLP